MRIRGATGEVHVERRGPFLFMTWFGKQDPELVDAYFDEYERLVREAQAAGERLVFITDALDADAPGPVIRRRIMERVETMQSALDATQLATFVVLASAVVRGALTAMSWLSRAPWSTEYVPTPGEAIDRGRAAIRAAGLTPPDEPSAASYERPTR